MQIRLYSTYSTQCCTLMTCMKTARCPMPTDTDCAVARTPVQAAPTHACTQPSTHGTFHLAHLRAMPRQCRSSPNSRMTRPMSASDHVFTSCSADRPAATWQRPTGYGQNILSTRQHITTADRVPNPTRQGGQRAARWQAGRLQICEACTVCPPALGSIRMSSGPSLSEKCEQH